MLIARHHSCQTYQRAIALLTALSGTALASSAFAGPVMNPLVDHELVEAYRQTIREFEQEQLLTTGDRFTTPLDPNPSPCVNTDQNTLGTGRTPIFPVPTANRNFTEIFWSYLPDGTAIEGSPGNFNNSVLEFSGQTEDPITVANGFTPTAASLMQSQIFSTLSNDIAPFGFGDLGGQVTWQTAVSRAFDRWSEISGLRFTFIGGDAISAADNPDSGNPWDVTAPEHPPQLGGGGGNIAEGDIRIAMTALDGSTNLATGTGALLAYVYPVGMIPSADGTDADPGMDPLTVNCNWGYQGNIILDVEERWSDPAAPNLLDIVMTRAIGRAIGLLPVCSLPGNPPFAIMEDKPISQPFPVLTFTELQEDDIRAVHNLYGDVFEPNDTSFDAEEIVFNLAAGATSFVFAPHLMIPPTNALETPTPLSIANNQPIVSFSDLNSPAPAVDVDKFRIAVPASNSGGFLLNITVQPIGSTVTHNNFVQERNVVTLTQGFCDTGDIRTTNALTRQALTVDVENFDPFTNLFTIVASQTAAAGSPVLVVDEPINDGIFFISIKGSVSTQPQLYNLTIEIKPQLAQSGLDMDSILGLAEISEFDTAGFTGTLANYAVLDGVLASVEHDTFGGRPRYTVAWPGAGPAVTQIGRHPTSVAALAIGGVNVAENFRGVAPDANFYSASLAGQLFADGSFIVSKTALYFALFGLADPVLSSTIGLPAPATVINSAWSGGGRAVTGDDTISQAYDAVASMHGVTIVSAAGNSGAADPACSGVIDIDDAEPGAQFLGSRSIVPPATALNGISVGAVASSLLPADIGAEFDIVAGFSSKGPIDTTVFDGSGTINSNVRSGIDILAPGTGIAPIPADFTPAGGTPLDRCDYSGAQPDVAMRIPGIDPLDDPNNLTDTGFFVPAQGTSMASAVVAGGVALLQDIGLANGYAIHGSVMKAIILNSAEKMSGWTNSIGNAPGKPQDQRDGAELDSDAKVIILGSIQPLDVAQGAGVFNFRRALENYHTGYLQVIPDDFESSFTFFQGPPTIDPIETHPLIPSMVTPPDPDGTNSLALESTSGAATMSFAPIEADEELPLSPIEIARRLSQTISKDRSQMIGYSLQLGNGKNPDLKGGRGPGGTPFTTDPVVPFIVPSLGRGGTGGPPQGGGGSFPGVPGSGNNGFFPTLIDPIFVKPIGWDFGNIDQATFLASGGTTLNTGFIDYIIEVPLLSSRPDPSDLSMTLPADILTVTLAWMRDITIEGMNFSSPTDPRIGAITALEMDNLDLFVFTVDANGVPSQPLAPIASSVSVWDTVEHMSFPIPQPGTYMIRVQWTNAGLRTSNYDLFGNRPLAETQYGVAWRVDFSERLVAAASFGMNDLLSVFDGWGHRAGTPGYKLQADINKDGIVDFTDIMTILTHWRGN